MDLPKISDQGKLEAAQFAEGLNKKLALTGGESAEQAFGMGCALGILPSLLIILALFLFKVINLVLAFILTAMAGLALVGISALLAYRARSNAIRRMFNEEINAEIEEYILSRQMSREQFDTLVVGLLPEDADLKAFLAPLPSVIRATDEEDNGGQVQ